MSKHKGQNGQGIIEYGFVLMLVIVGLIAIIAYVSNNVDCPNWECIIARKTDVIRGEARDELWGIEYTRGGSANIWLKYDSVASYCTNNESMAEQASDILLNHDGEVYITFKTIKPGEEGWDFWNGTDCGSFGADAASSGTVTYHLMTLRAVSHRSGDSNE